MDNPGRRAVIYARISQDREGAGLGVDRQVTDCRALAERLGWTVVAVHQDNDISAYSGRLRPGYRDLLADLDAGRATGVLAWHVDRLHRSPRELETYIDTAERHGVITHTVQAGDLDLSTPSGRAVARTLGAWARYESEHKGERIKRARQQAAQAGRFKGGRRPFGYGPDGLALRADEAAEVLRGTEGILAGASLRSIVRDLNARGVRTVTGAGWTSQALREILLRARNAGLSEYRGEVVGPALWPAIVTEEQWRACASILRDPSRRTSPTDATVKWLGSGLYLCGVCGQPSLRCSTSGSKRLPAYRCMARENGKGGHVTRAAAPLDEYVQRVAVALLQRPDAADLVAPPGEGTDTAAAHAEAVTLRQRLDDLSTAYADGDVTLAQLRAGSDRLRSRLDELDASIAAAVQVSPLFGLAGAEDVERLWWGTGPDHADGLDLGRRRAVIDSLMTVTVLPTGRGRRPDGTYFDPDGVRVEPRW